MKVLVVVPEEQLPEGQAVITGYEERWKKAGQEIIRRTRKQVHTSSQDDATIITYPVERRSGNADICGQAADVLMIHLDLLCCRDWYELEPAILASITGRKGLSHVHRRGEFKVYSVEPI